MKDHPILSVIGKSPIKPIQHHYQIIHKIVMLLPDLIEACHEADEPRSESIYQEILTLSAKGKDLKREIRVNMPRSYFMSISRPDLLELLHRQDKLSDKVKSVARIFVVRKMQFPSQLQQKFEGLVVDTTNISKQAYAVIDNLDELFETGFGRHEADKIVQMLEELDETSVELDLSQHDVNCALFAIEKQLNPVDVIFYYNAIEAVEDLAHHGRKVGRALSAIVNH